MKKIKLFFLWWWYKLIRRKLIEDKMVLNNCQCYYVNVFTKDHGIVKPVLSKTRTWYGKVTGEHMTIKKLPGMFYFKALNEKNAERKASTILDKFYNDVR